jgi:hypothetical protein
MIAAKNDATRGSGQKREDFHARFKEKYDKIASSKKLGMIAPHFEGF